MLEVLKWLQVNLLGGSFFLESCRSRVYPWNFIKKDFNIEVFLHWLCTVALFKLSGNFLPDIFAKHFLTKLQTTNRLVTTLMKIKCLTKICRTNPSFKSGLYCVKDYSCIRIPIPMLMPMPIFDAEISKWLFPCILSFSYGKEGVCL